MRTWGREGGRGERRGRTGTSVVMEKAPMVSAVSDAQLARRGRRDARERGAGEETSCGKEMVRESVVIDK